MLRDEEICTTIVRQNPFREFLSQHIFSTFPGSLNNLALLYKSQGKYEQAEPLYVRALAIREQQLGPNHPNTQQACQNYAALLRAMNRNEEAKQLEEGQ